MECVRECFNHGEMSSSQRKAIITLIEKQHKDRTLIENWRPISLINVDAKIISKVIALRLKKALPNIIHHNQTGYVEGRYIGETIRSIFDIILIFLPRNAKNLEHDFGLSDEDLKIAYNLPHPTAQEPYVKSAQYKVLNSILYTNTKLFKIGYLQDDKCTFGKTEQETLGPFILGKIRRVLHKTRYK